MLSIKLHPPFPRHYFTFLMLHVSQCLSKNKSLVLTDLRISFYDQMELWLSYDFKMTRYENGQNQVPRSMIGKQKKKTDR